MCRSGSGTGIGTVLPMSGGGLGGVLQIPFPYVPKNLLRGQYLD